MGSAISNINRAAVMSHIPIIGSLLVILMTFQTPSTSADSLARQKRGAFLDTLCTQCSYCVGQADTASACAAGCAKCPCDSQVDSSCAFCESGESFTACTKRCTGGCNICKGRDGNGLKICKNRGQISLA